MKKLLKIIGFILVIIITYITILKLFPKEINRFPFLVLLFITDLYLWNSFKTWRKRQKLVVRSVLAFLYWSPLIMLSILIVSQVLKFEMIADEKASILIKGFIFSAYAAKLLPIMSLILTDLIRGGKLLVNLKHKKTKEKLSGTPISRNLFLRQIGLVSGGLLFSGLIVGMIKWVYDFKIHHHSIRFPNLPNGFKGFRIVQISDLHLGSWYEKKDLDNAIDSINKMNPHVIFFTGDLVNYKTDEAYKFKKSLSKLRADYGVFAILGNHDYGDYKRWPTPKDKENNLTDLFDFYRNIGWKLLKNNYATIEREGGKLTIIGVENWGAIARFPQYGDIEKAIKGVEKADFKILLSHDPSYWEKVISSNYTDIDLTLSGHTHGFQFGVESKVIKWSPAQYVYKYWAGLYSKKSDNGNIQYLYVNRGLGTIGYPGRVGILPEITLIELNS